MAIEPVLAAKRILRRRFDAAAGEPIRPFPTVFAAETRILSRQQIMQRCFASAATGLELAVRPGHLIMEPEHLGHTLAKECAVIRPWREAPNVDRPKIQRGFACLHPFGKKF